MTGKVLAQVGVFPRNGRIAWSVNQNRITPFRGLRIAHRPQRDVEAGLQERTPSVTLFIRKVEVDLRVGQADIVTDRHRFGWTSQRWIPDQGLQWPCLLV